ncbi:MAG: prepilin-type N-terminal cleavage/methylation domain-containing protein [bacterium]
MVVAKVKSPRSIDLVLENIGGVMSIDIKIGITKERRRERGFGLTELVIAVAIIGAIATVALINFRSAKESIRVQNSVRQLASYMEKARIDAVRRHGESSVKFTSPTSYTVNMDFSNTGVPTDRIFNLETGVQVPNSELPNVKFNWRGRTVTPGSSCVTTFAVINTSNPSEPLNIDVSGSGDVTVESKQPTLPNVPYNNTIPASSAVRSTTVVSGTEAVDSTPCLDVSGQGVGGEAGPPQCTIHVASTSVSVKKNGGGSTSVLVSMSVSSGVVASYPSNLTVTPASQTVSTGSSFLINSNNNQRGPFNVTFSSQCGSTIIVKVNVTN